MNKIFIFTLFFFSISAHQLANSQNYSCDISFDKINTIKFPDLYNFNIINIKFNTGLNDNWKIFDISLAQNLDTNVKKLFDKEMLLVKDIIKGKKIGYNEKKFYSELLKSFNYEYSFEDIEREVRFLSSNEKNNLIRELENNIAYPIDELREYILNSKEDIINNFNTSNMIVNSQNGYLKINIKENNTNIELLANIRDLNKNFFNMNINLSENFFELSLLGNCKNISNKVDNVQNENDIDCFNEKNLNLFPGYCASKILELYPISDSNDESIHLTNDEESEKFIEFCKKSTLDSLDKDVALLCLKKMN